MKQQIANNKIIRKKKIYFLGLLYSDEMLVEAGSCSKVGIQTAPHIFQQNLLRGFADRRDVSLSVIHVPPIGSYPIHYTKALIHSDEWKEGYQQLGFLNVPVIKHIIQERSIKEIIENEINSGVDQYIFIYSMYPPFVRAANSLKKKYPHLHVCLLQTDPIPGKDGIYTKNTGRNIRKGEMLINYIQSFDSFVVLTKYLAEAMEIEDKPYIIVDCIIDESNTGRIVTEKQTGRNRFLYTGSTRDTNGIKTLVDAFAFLPEAELWICGGGNSDEYIRERERTLGNIKFFGSIDHSKIADIQSQCDYMINPRRPEGGFTKYSFPSKTAEYLMTGMPTIMYHLEGLSREYDNIVNYVCSNDPKGLADELQRIISTDYGILVKRATAAREFMIREKNPKRQAERIIALLENNNV